MLASMWDTIIKAIGGYGSLVAALGVLLLLWWQHGYNKALEQVKAESQKRGKESEITFSALHKKRTEIIADLYVKIVEALRSIEYLTLATKPLKQGEYNQENDEKLQAIRKATIDKVKDLGHFIMVNRIYFPEKLFVELNTLDESIRKRVSLAASDFDSSHAVHVFIEDKKLKEEISRATACIENLFIDLFNGKEIDSPPKE